MTTKNFLLPLALGFSLLAAPPAKAAAKANGHAPASADEALDPAFEVAVDPDAYPVGAFAKHGFNAKPMPAAAPASSFSPPRPEIRDEAFAKIPGLAGAVAGMDALDQDLLYIRARNYAPEKIKSIYPKMDQEMLMALRAELRKE